MTTSPVGAVVRDLVEVPIGLGSVDAASGAVRVESLGDGVRLLIGMVLGDFHGAADNFGLGDPPPPGETLETVGGILVEREARPVFGDLHTIMLCGNRSSVKRPGCCALYPVTRFDEKTLARKRIAATLVL